MQIDSKDYLKKNRFSLIGGVISLPFLIYLLVFSCSQRKLFKEMDNSGLNDTAIIIRDFIGAKGSLFYEYEFKIDKNTYNGVLLYSPSQGPVNVGDTFLVKYLPSDPDNINKLVQNTEFLLIKP